MNVALAGARFRQPGFAVVVGGGAEGDDDEGGKDAVGDDEDVWGTGAVDSPESCGVAAAEGDAELVAELDVVGTGVGVLEGQLTFGNIWTSRRTAPPGRLCCAYSTGRPGAPTIPSSSWSAATETLPRLGEYPDVLGRLLGPVKQPNMILCLGLAMPVMMVASVAADRACWAASEYKGTADDWDTPPGHSMTSSHPACPSGTRPTVTVRLSFQG
jgi:hypothetical protein